MTQNSDYKKPRHNILDIIPGRFRTDVNNSLMETTFNRYLTKTELAKVVGTIGRTSNGATSNQIVEETPHRQAFQLQPLLYKKIGTVESISSYKDILRELDRLGVDINRLPKWGNTESFNFAPPIDFDKLINYADYFWYNPDDINSTPQYITVRNNCNVANARLKEKILEIESLGTLTIVGIDGPSNVIILNGNVVDAFQVGVQFDIEGSTSNDGSWTVVEAELDGTQTRITIEEMLVDYTVDGEVTFSTLVQQLKNDYNCACSQSIGWDSQPWDAVDDGVLWDGSTSCEAPSLSAQSWSTDNFWTHRRDLPPNGASVAQRAQLPIIEYMNTLEFNEWNLTVHNWYHRESENDPWILTTTQPSLADIFSDFSTKTLNPTFHTLWAYSTASQPIPVNSQPVDPDVLVIEVNTTDPNLILTTTDHQTYTIPLTQQQKAIAGTDDIRVYVDGVRQYGTYIENYSSAVVMGYPSNFITGITFFDTIANDSDVRLELNHKAVSDIGYDVVPVRLSTADSYTVELRNVVKYRKAEQVKEVGEHVYPVFDIYTVEGTPTNTTSSIFTFQHSPTAPVNTATGMRIVMDSTPRPYFQQHLLNPTTGEMFLYKDSTSISTDNPEGFESIWRTGVIGGEYVPKLVDENGRADGEEFYDADGILQVASVDFSNGDWEIPSQLLYNASHENREVVSFTDLVAHFTSMVSAHPLPEGYFLSPSVASRLYYRPEYGAGGTIKEYNDSYDLFLSALFVQNNNPVSVLKFANNQYDDTINTIKEIFRLNSVDYLLNDSDEFLSDIVTEIITAVISQYELNDVASRVYGDSGSYNDTTNVGIRNFIASLAMLRLAHKVQPVNLEDEALGIYELRHHDGHISSFKLNQTTIKNINAAVVNTVIESGRKRGWTSTASADGSSPVPASFDTIDYTRLRKNDYWLESNGLDLYRFEVVAIQTNSPSVINFAEGSYWLRDTDGQLHQLQDIAGTSTWVPVGTAGDHSPAWALVDLNSIVREIILDVETKLFDVIPNFDTLVWNETDYILDGDDQILYDSLLETSFNNYVRERAITDPYVVDYNPSDAFTWNYSNVDVSSPLVTFPGVKDVTKWGARWYVIYQNVFGTPYPHLEPWVLQGYNSKPTWWDTEYQGTSRRWSTAMWNNIKAGIIPVGKTPPSGSVPVYSFVCVNTTDSTTTDGYGPDALLPPFWIPPVDSPVAPEDLALINETFLRNEILITGVGIDQSYVFGDQGPIEWEWRKSSTYLYDKLIISFLLQPVRFMHHTWGIDLIYRGSLNIDNFTNKVFAHQDTIFHGDLIAGETYMSTGINQWYVNYNRYRNNDVKNSDFRPLWVEWLPRMAYQFGGFIDPRSLDVSTSLVNFDVHDYDVTTKISRGFRNAYQDSLKVSVLKYGSFITRRNTKIPRGEGHDWVFSVTSPALTSIDYKYYSTKNFKFSVTDTSTGLLTSTSPLLFDTGDVVTVHSTDLLPSPLKESTDYYVIKLTNQTFKLATSAANATDGTFIVFTDSGEGELRVQQVKSNFFAQGGERTAINWHHHVVDTDVVNTVQFPLQITGVQSLIDFIDGYIQYQRDQGFVFNDTSVTEIDSDTGLIVSWQVEIERLITAIYDGIGLNNVPDRYKGQLYLYEADYVTDTITPIGVPFAFEEGQEVYVFATGASPTGLLMNTPYYVIPTSNGRFKLASTYQNAIDGIHIDLTTNGYGTQYLGVFEIENVDLQQYVEVNAFRNNLWYAPTEGIISDVVAGPFPDYRTERVIYDQYGRSMNEGQLRVYREDKLTRIYALPELSNDVSAEQDPYNYLHISGAHLFVDGYEHVLLFENYTTDDSLIYDPFLGVYINAYNLRFESQIDRNRRPTVGGFVSHGNDLIRNIEGTAEDIQSFYDTYGLRERADYLDHARDVLGYTNPDYFDLLNATDRTKFVFWKGLIQQKGSVNAVKAFINSKRFIDARIDEHWAYRVATYGDSRERTFANLKVNVNDLVGSDLRYDFRNNPERTFIGVTFNDQDRWSDLPGLLDSRYSNSTSYFFDVERTPSEVSFDSTSSVYVVINAPHAAYKVFDYTTGVEITSSFIQLNAQVLKYIAAAPLTATIIVEGINVAAQQQSPMKLKDVRSNATIAELTLWDPAKGHHNPHPLRIVDVVGSSDPYHFAAGKQQPEEYNWTTNSVGKVWWDTSTLGYVPYYDRSLYTDLSKQMSEWGLLADWASVDLYEWVESPVHPDQYNDYAQTQEGDTTIPQTERASGEAKVSVWYNGVVVDESELHKDFYVAEGTPPSSTYFTPTSSIVVYVNGKQHSEMLFGDFNISDFKERDHIHMVRKYKTGDVLDTGFTEAVDYISIDTYADNNVDVETKYYFWVKNKSVRKAGYVYSLEQAASELTTPTTPYFLCRNYQAATGGVPDRFTQLLIRNLVTQIDTEDRYMIEMVKDFSFRDRLVDGTQYEHITTSGTFNYSSTRHPIFEEWTLFRKNGEDVVPLFLWNKLVEAVAGERTDEYGNTVPVPAIERTVYDSMFDKTTRYGIQNGQAFGDRLRLIETIQETIADVSFDISPINKREFFDTYNFNDATAAETTMNYILTGFPTAAVNEIFFNCLHDALSVKLEYADIMKTSFVSVYGIKLLETVESI